MVWNQIPRPAEIVGAAIDSLVINRPSAVPFANNGLGRYADLITGWNAQCTLALQRLTSEAIAKRISMATGAPLTDLCRSEYDTDRDINPVTTAVGTVAIVRATTTAGAGVITVGTRLKRTANTSSNPPVPGAFYVVTQDTFVSGTSTSVIVPIAGAQPGSAANALDLYGYPPLTFVDTPFDPTLTPVTFQGYHVAGGADGKTDDDLRIEAMAYAIGRYGPTIGSVLAGAYRGTGVRHAAVIDISWVNATQTHPGFNPAGPAAYTAVLVADASWAGGINTTPVSQGPWIQTIQQQLQDPINGFIGVGEKAIVTAPQNQAITVTCTVMLADQNYAAFTTDIISSIQVALKAYFDERPDWYTFQTSAVQSVIASADPRIRTCTAATVNDFESGAVFADPPQVPPAYPTGIEAYHWYLVSNGVNANFIAPQ